MLEHIWYAIIPTLNEAESIWALVIDLLHDWTWVTWVVVVDGWSNDDTIHIAKKAWAEVVITNKPWRSHQMNTWASYVKELNNEKIWTNESNSQTFLRFVHADVILPSTRKEDLNNATSEWHLSWCFRSRFDGNKSSSKSNLLRETTTRWTSCNHRLFRMWGQTVRLDQQIFDELGGFDEWLIICEDVDLYRKIYKHKSAEFKVLPSEVIVSARKFEVNGYVKMYSIYVILYIMYRLRISQKTMITFYTKHVSSERLASAEEYHK